MSDIEFIKRYAKQQLNDWKTLPEYQYLRDRVGIDNLNNNFARNCIARTCNFNSWEDLLLATDEQKYFIKLILSHPEISPDGFFGRDAVPSWNEQQWMDWAFSNIRNITFPYKYKVIKHMSEQIKDIIKPIKSINYKTDHSKVYFVVGKEILRNYMPCGNVFDSDFIFAMLLAGFRLVKSDTEHKFWFNVSQKQLKAIQQTQQLNKELFGSDDWAAIDHMYADGGQHFEKSGYPVI